MDQDKHNGHYDYFLTNSVIEYQASKPQGDIDKELYMKHDEKIMKEICDFYEICKQK